MHYSSRFVSSIEAWCEWGTGMRSWYRVPGMAASHHRNFRLLHPGRSSHDCIPLVYDTAQYECFRGARMSEVPSQDMILSTFIVNNRMVRTDLHGPKRLQYRVRLWIVPGGCRRGWVSSQCKYNIFQ